MKYCISIICLTLFLNSCASSPEKIKGQYVSPIIYQSYTCEQLINEHTRLIRHLNQAYDAQKKSASNDTIATGVGIVLFFPSLFFLGDDSRATEYARLKGELNALGEALVKGSCNTGVLELPKDQKLKKPLK